MGKRAQPKRRNHLPPPVDTAEGSMLAAAAGKWFLSQFRRDPLRFVGHAENGWLPTQSLPGYTNAYDSARVALTQLVGELKFVRWMFPFATGQQPWDAKGIALLIAEINANGYPIANLEKHLQRLDEAGQLTVYHREYARITTNIARRKLRTLLVPVKRALPSPFADLHAVPFHLVIFWVSAGFWLSTTDTIVHQMNAMRLQEFRGSEDSVISQSNIDAWITRLGLHRFGGPGKASLSQGKIVFDDELKTVVTSALHA